MSISLEKRAEKVGIVLAKRGLLAAPKTRVGVAVDVSGSARPFYRNGQMQETLDRLLAVATKFDDNGELDAWAFDNNVVVLPTITAEDEGTYVADKLVPAVDGMWGGTSYAPTLEAAMKFYFGDSIASKVTGFFGSLFDKKQSTPTPTSNEPAMLLFITDGENNDRTDAANVLRQAAANSPMYFNMVGIGPERQFGFLKDMADELPNVGFVSMSTLEMTDEELYERVVSQEFVDWIKKI